MLLLATLAVLAATEPPPGGTAPERQARATVRILRPVRISLGEEDASGEATVRRTRIRASDGSLQQAVLVEFS